MKKQARNHSATGSFKVTLLTLGLAAVCSQSALANNALMKNDLTRADINAITASGENGTREGRLQAFDNEQQTKWLTFDTSGWLSYEFASATTIASYSITSANDVQARDPQDWRLEGSNDGINWQVLDNRSGERFSQRFQKKTYTISQPQAFKHTRLNVTSNLSGNILQLAEIELFGEQDGGSVSLPLQESNSLVAGQWQHFGPFNVSGEIIANTSGSGDADLFMRLGAQPTSDVYDCKSITPIATESCKISGQDAYVSVYAYSDTNYTIDIKENSVPDNGNWKKPIVDFVDMNPETEGSRLLKRIIADPSGHMAQRCIDVAKVLYKNSNESNRFRKLRFELRAKNFSGNEFVAYKSGQDGSGEMTIAVSTTHLAKLYRDGGNSDAAIRNEIDGILFHEVTHGYNNSPQTHDGYGDGGAYWAYTEGIADAVRIGAGFHKTRSPDVNGSRKWLSGYTTTGFFLHYVKTKIDAEFIYKFNKSARDMQNYSWSFDASFREITGRGVNDVWTEYKNFINNGGKLVY